MSAHDPDEEVAEHMAALDAAVQDQKGTDCDAGCETSEEPM